MSLDLLNCIGNTPLLRISRITADLAGVEIYAKAEWFNPGGSVKDRPALRMILEGERQGLLTKDKIIIDSTSGNTGIAYAMIGAIKGYRVQLVVPANVSFERKRILDAYGASVIYSDPLEGSDGAARVAHEIYDRDPERYFMPDQYNNPFNWIAHYDTTGPEKNRQTDGRITHFVAGIGTSGTLMGTGRRLKEYNLAIKVIAVEPAMPLHGLEGLKHMPTAKKPGIWEPNFPDRILSIETEDAYAMVKRLGREEGLFVGLSSGAAMVGALEVARTLERGVIVVVFPDGGDKYLSTRLWE